MVQTMNPAREEDAQVAAQHQYYHDDAVKADMKYNSKQEKLTELGMDSNVFSLNDDKDKDSADEEDGLKWYHVFRFNRIGMPLHYLVVGILYGYSTGCVLPVYLYYLGASSALINVMASFPTMFFNFKLFYGILGDCLPIMGYRRRSYLVLGWCLCFVFTMITFIWLLTSPTSDFCFPPDEARNQKVLYSDPKCDGLEKYTMPVFSASIFGCFLLLQNFGYMFADVAADSLSVQWAQEESLHDRGQIQANNYAIRFVGFIISYCITGFGLNGIPYGGTWDEYVSKQDRASFSQNMRDVWSLLKQKAFCCVFIFAMGYNFLMSFTPKVAQAIPNSSVLSLTPMEKTLQNIVSTFIYIGVLWIVGLWLRNVNWRWNNVFAMILVVSSQFLVLPVVLGPLQFQSVYYIFTNCVTGVFQYLNYLVVIWAVNELRIPGLEGTAIALATGAGDLCMMIGGSWFSNLLGLAWPSQNDIGSTTNGWTHDYIYNMLVTSALNLLPLTFLWLIPSNKEMANYRKETWGESKLLGGITLVVYVIVFVLAIT
eukprot:Pgem_evm1s3557